MFNKKQKQIQIQKEELEQDPVLRNKEIEKRQINKQEEEKALIEAERTYLEGSVDILDFISPSAVQVTPNYLRVGAKFVRTLFVTGYPRYVDIGWFEPIIDYSATLDMSMYFYPLESKDILKQLRNKVGILEAQVMGEQEKGAPRDPEAETALRDIEQLRDDLTQGTEKFFHFGLYITMYADEQKELDLLTEKIESILGTKSIYTKRSYWQCEQGFNSTLPMASDQLAVGFNMQTSPCASSFPFVSSELSSDSGVLYGINRHNNSLIVFDRFSLQNANEMVFATSGAGKSYAIKLEVLRSLMLGTDVIIIDPEREYQYLSDAVGGTYVNISLNSKAKINPFDLPVEENEETSTSDIIRSSIITIKGLLRIMIGKVTHAEDSVLDRALLETYAKKDIVASTNLKKFTGQFPVMSDLQDVLENMEGGEELAQKLDKYTNGTFSGLLDNLTNVDMDNQLVIFSVRDLEDELRPMAIYTIINYIWAKVRSKLKKRILVVDEAWWLMQHEDSAKFIFALAKRCRKYYLGLTTITQDVNDFLTSPYGQAILTNSSLQLLLKQSSAAIDIVTDTFRLTKGERYLLLESGVGEGIFFAGAKHAAIKIIASYTEDQIITSDPRQVLEIEEAKKDLEEE